MKRSKLGAKFWERFALDYLMATSFLAYKTQVSGFRKTIGLYLVKVNSVFTANNVLDG